MVHRSTLVIIAAVGAFGMVSPAHARRIETVPHHHVRVLNPQGNLRDFAPVPSRSYSVPSQPYSNSDFPAIRMDREDF